MFVFKNKLITISEIIDWDLCLKYKLLLVTQGKEQLIKN